MRSGSGQKVWFRAGAQPFYEVCPYPYEGPATPQGPLGCYISPIVGTLNGTWLYYVPLENCEFILPANKPGAVWREGKELWACWGLGVYKTTRGTIFTEGGEPQPITDEGVGGRRPPADPRTRRRPGPARATCLLRRDGAGYARDCRGDPGAAATAA